MFKNVAMALACATLLCLGPSPLAHAATAVQPASIDQRTTNQVRIQRLAGLARTWGTARYFHPWLAYKPVDWDKALVDTIPKVNAARSQADYVAALNDMLAALGDPVTVAKAVANETPEDGKPAPAKGEPIRLEAGVLHIDAPAAGRRISAGGNDVRMQLPARVRELAAQAKSVVIDLRRDGKDWDFDLSGIYYEHQFLMESLPTLFDRQATLPAARYRLHDGYATQAGVSSGDYVSALVTESPAQLFGSRKDSALPIAIVVNAHSAAVDLASGLRSAGLAHLIQAGTAAPRATDIRTFKPAPGIELTLAVADSVNADGSVGFTADEVVTPEQAQAAVVRALAGTFPRKAPAAVAQSPVPASEMDRDYRDMAFPSPEYRLLALFRYWSVIEHFFPYKDLIGDDWDTVLARYIPRFEANTSALDYQRTVHELATEIHDSHGSVQGGTALQEHLGQFVPPVLLRHVEGQTVAVKSLAADLPLHSGDTVLTVDGMPVERLREQWARLIPASTPQALQLQVHWQLLRGAKDSSVRLGVRAPDGSTREVVLVRSLGYRDGAYRSARKRTRPAVDILHGGIAYVDLDRLARGDVDSMFERIRSTAAVIFDMRGYPNGTAWPIAPRLAKARRPIAARFSRMLVKATDLGADESSRHDFDQRLDDHEGDLYPGKVVMLINEESISQSEHTGLFLEAATDVTFIGMPTAGANGDVTRMVLPGGLGISFTGHSVRHADGRQLQRVGLQPQVRVAPTIAGVAAGRDEVLEAAVKFLRDSK